MASIIGTPAGTSASAARITSTSWSNSLHSTLALELKYRKNVLLLTPASAAICSIVVLSKPWPVNRRRAISSSSRRLAPGGRPLLGSAGSGGDEPAGLAACGGGPEPSRG